MKSQVFIKPRISEKAYAHNMVGIYVFDVPTEANKFEVAEAVQAAYGVEVVKVKTLKRKGKKARSIRLKSKTASRVYGKRPDTKKAYVTLKKGDHIKIKEFEAVEEETKAKK